MELKEYIAYLRRIGKSENTVMAYCKDIELFAAEQQCKGVVELKDTTETEVVSYALKLKQAGMSSSTINRKISSLRAYFNYLMSIRVISENPTNQIKSPKAEKKETDYLTTEEIERLLKSPDDSIKGTRDKALLELMYATGIRVSELIDMKVDEVNLRMNFVMCASSSRRARVIPFGKKAKKAMEEYLKEVRPVLIGEKETENFFVNYNGEPLSRQGIWKILKEYASKAEIEKSITPQVLRNSFAIHMLQNGADIKTLQTLLGQEDIVALEAYCAMVKTGIKEVYDRVHPRA